MSGIAGIASSARPGRQAIVARMLAKIAHRGPAGRKVIEDDGVILGTTWTAYQAITEEGTRGHCTVCDTAGDERLAGAQVMGDKPWPEPGRRLTLVRDPFGVAPLYYGKADDGALCFASEVKALLEATSDVHELPPGSFYDGLLVQPYFRLEQPPLDESPEEVAQELRRRLAAAVEKRGGNGEVGSWLSGGLDSSTMAALARPHVSRLHTFAVGLPGAADLEYARVVADFIGSEHHEVIVSFEQMLAVLPQVIYHLESFDALLVRSSITNYLVAKAASDYVPAVFSGEGGDELFAGYEYLKSLDPALLADELLDITGRLHNTALQRVDRCASAHGTVAHVPFLDPAVAEYALRIPTSLKLRDGVEKWILRQAMDGALPESVLNRTKAKFWEGAGVGDLLARHADERISDADFRAERVLPNDWILNSKEELMYYRIFREHFGELDDLSWMGRTKSAPGV
jgi:asparagine synthase (glutamine-hydrolysing)